MTSEKIFNKKLIDSSYWLHLSITIANIQEHTVVSPEKG